jgi:UDP-glucose 4-epimerase
MGFDPMMQVIHERDVVEAILLALAPGSRGIYNLRGPGELPLSRMWRLLGKKPTPVPGPLLHTLLRGLWSSRATNFPKEELDHLRYICLVDDTRARKELGFTPKFGIEETIQAVNAEW